MKIARIYHDNHGKSHFGEVDIVLNDGGPIGLLSEKFGADKIILGSNAIKEPKLINEISHKYGNQSITQSIDCKKILFSISFA